MSHSSRSLASSIAASRSTLESDPLDLDLRLDLLDLDLERVLDLRDLDPCDLDRLLESEYSPSEASSSNWLLSSPLSIPSHRMKSVKDEEFKHS